MSEIIFNIKKEKFGTDDFGLSLLIERQSKRTPKSPLIYIWYTRYDSNVRPSVPKTDALIH